MQPAIAETDTAFLDIADQELRRAIITEWERTMSTVNLTDVVCAVCGRSTPCSNILFVKPRKVPLHMLANLNLPEILQPMTYNRAAYDGAILHPKGLLDTEQRGDLRICQECRKPLLQKRLPRFALANWLYYAHERLPTEVGEAFRGATHMEKTLIARARASTISFKFSELKGHALEGTPSAVSQRCVKGNVAIHPQDATHLNQVLPPGNDIIRDTVCAVFVGETKPTKETIEKLRPVLVRKTRVKTMIEFLTLHNPHYKVSTEFRGYSQRNMDDLFGPGTRTVEEGVPCAMEIGCIAANEVLEAATDGYVPGSEAVPGPDDSGMLMETVGYVESDDSPMNYRDMSMRALTHCLNGGTFIQSQAGSRFIPDFENASLLAWLFPHLDPWGIGGFHEKRRLVPLSMDQQLKYLLAVDGSPFKEDPDFAFVYYNIQQKKAVLDSVTFRVPESQRKAVVGQLLKVNVKTLESMTQAFASDPHYTARNEEEAAILKLLIRVNTVAHDLPGSNGYKVMLRNQIRALINHEGTPTLFVTLNPSDRDHPLVRLYAGHEVDVEDHMRGEELSRWQRSIIAANHPSACARFFNTMISNFIRIVLRFGLPGRGLFG
ncbi:hypothetical protein OH77DRAFT_1395674, partial [Trametes cingulata]